MELNNPNLKESLSQVFINSADLTQYTQKDGSVSKAVVVKIPFRSLQPFRKVSENVVQHLEQKFGWPVFVIATRGIISKRGRFSLFRYHTSIFDIIIKYDNYNIIFAFDRKER